MYKKLLLTLVYLVLVYFLFTYKDTLLFWLQSDSKDRIFITAIVATLMSLFPIVPYPIVGGLIGAAYGPFLGGFITWLGSTLASIIMFLFIRYILQDFGMRILHSYKTMEKVTVLFERNAFLAIVFARVIPFIPSIVINVYSALSRVSFVTYSFASAIGKIPAMLLFAILGDYAVTQPSNMVLTGVIYLLFMAIVYFLYKKWNQAYQLSKN